MSNNVNNYIDNANDYVEINACEIFEAILKHNNIEEAIIEEWNEYQNNLIEEEPSFGQNHLKEGIYTLLQSKRDECENDIDELNVEIKQKRNQLNKIKLLLATTKKVK